MKKTYITAFLTIVRKEMTRFFRIWSETLLPSAITITLYFIIFGTTLGSQIGPVKGFTYIQYIAPGLILMAVITNAYSNVVFSFYLMRFTKSIEELLVAPIPNYLILLGFISGGVARGVIVGAIVTLIALFFTHLHIYNALVIVSVVLLVTLVFALAGFANALFAKRFDDTTIIPTFVLTPLNYLGGIFYPVAFLPPLWRHLSMCNPILYMVNAFRYGMLGITDVSLTAAFVVLLVCCVGLFAVNLYMLNKGVGIKT